MKLNRLLLMSVMGLGLFACNNNDLVEGSGPEGTQTEGTTYVGLKINFNSSSSRATGDQPVDGSDGTTPPHYDDEGDGNENVINDVRIVVTDEDGNSQYNNVVQPILNNNNNNIYLFKITPGIKKFYAVVNGQSLGLEDQLSSWAGEQKTLLMKASQLYQYEEKSEEGKGFLMSSVEAVERSIQNNITIEDVKAGKANNVEITVERVVAKVTMKLNGSGINEEGLTLKNLTCQIGNADNLEYATGEQTYTTAGTYLMAYNDENVRKTPYFTYPETNTDDFWAQFDQAQLLGSEETSIYPTGTARFYCLENTHTNTNPKNYLQGNTTFIRVKATMIPKSAKQFTYNPGPEPTVTISNKGEETIPTDPKTFYIITGAPEQNALNAYVFAEDLANLYETLVTEGNAATIDEKAAAVITALAKDKYYFTKPYTNGCGYYNIWVNDMKDDKGQILNIAPVFRNDWYDLTITSLTLPGSPTGDIDPEEPIHPDTYVGVTLTVRDWNKVYHDIDLQ